MPKDISQLPLNSETIADEDFIVIHNVSKAALTRDERVLVNKFRTDFLLGRTNTFTANQRVDALASFNEAPNSNAQLLVTSGSAGRRALQAKSAASPTVPVFEIISSSNVVRHSFWSDYGTNIAAARIMNGYHEIPIIPGNITTQALTVEIIGTSFSRAPVIMEIFGSFYNNSDNTTIRAMWIDDVMWTTRLNASTPATINSSNRRMSDINGVTVTGPTAINAGIRYTVQGTANLVRAGMMIRAFSWAPLNVTATVA